MPLRGQVSIHLFHLSSELHPPSFITLNMLIGPPPSSICNRMAHHVCRAMCGVKCFSPERWTGLDRRLDDAAQKAALTTGRDTDRLVRLGRRREQRAVADPRRKSFQHLRPERHGSDRGTVLQPTLTELRNRFSRMWTSLAVRSMLRGSIPVASCSRSPQ